MNSAHCVWCYNEADQLQRERSCLHVSSRHIWSVTWSGNGLSGAVRCLYQRALPRLDTSSSHNSTLLSGCSMPLYRTLACSWMPYPCFKVFFLCYPWALKHVLAECSPISKHLVGDKVALSSLEGVALFSDSLSWVALWRTSAPGKTQSLIGGTWGASHSKVWLAHQTPRSESLFYP
jgi:hypothetical protein